MPVGTEQFWLIAERRMNSVIAMAVVAICQAMATVAFHTVTNNRIITPSIMGFESLYVLIHTSTVFSWAQPDCTTPVLCRRSCSRSS